MAFVVVIEIVASNRKSKKEGRMNECEKADKLSNMKERERVVSIFFHLFAFDADVCAVPLCIRVYVHG